MTNIVSSPASYQSAMTTALTAPKEISQNPNNVEKTAKEFEGIFISQMLSHMFDGVSANPMFGGGSAENMWRDMMVQEYGSLISDNGGIGMSDSIKSMMLQMQEQVDGA